jgi:hypothetical protein
MKTGKAGFWIGLLAVASSIACVVSLFLTTVGASSPQANSVEPEHSSEVAPETYEGIIADTRCEAKHSSRAGLSAGDCTRACVHAGEQFVLIDGDKAYILEGNAPALKRAAGERVKVTGKLNGNAIAVSSVISAAKAE